MHATFLLNVIVVTTTAVLRATELLATPQGHGHITDVFFKKQQCHCECAASRTIQRGKIVGGLETEPHEFPWLAAIFLSRRVFHCGGTVITQHHILTAAHCLDKRPEEYEVKLGMHTLYDLSGESYPVVQTIAHGLYEPFRNDIGLMKLGKKILFQDDISAACLPQSWMTAYHVGEMGIVVGWGRTGETANVANEVQKVGVPLISLSECMRHYEKNELTENMICAGYPEGKKDACQGDSGGPLHLLNKHGYLEVIGIVSFGRGCARANTPGVYTKIADYMDWLFYWTGEDCFCTPSALYRYF